jgi:hypothetical protein
MVWLETTTIPQVGQCRFRIDWKGTRFQLT